MALSLSGTGGMQAMVGIQLRMGTQGVVTGATLANQQLDKLSTTARRTARNINTTEQAMQRLHQEALQASAGLATAGFALFSIGKKILGFMGTHVVDAAGDYEVAMSRVQFSTQATAKEMKSLDKVMVDVGLKTIETPTSAADAFRGLRTAGLKTNEALELLPKTIQMVTGAAGMMGMDQAVRASVSAVKKFQHQGVPFSKTMDDIAQATRETALQWQDMPAFFNALRDAPMRLRATSAEMLSLGGLMKAGGMQAAQSGQALSIFANKLITNDRKIKAVMLKKGLTKEQFYEIAPKELRQRMIMLQKFGISMFDAAGKMKPFQQTLIQVVKRMNELMEISDEEGLTTLSGVFGQQAGSMISMLRQLSAKGIDAGGAIRNLITAVDDSEGAMERAEQAFLRTAKGIQKLIEGTNQTIGIILGKTVIPLFSVLLQQMKFLLDSFLKFVQANPMFAKALTVTAVALGVVATVAGAVALGLGAVLFFTEILGPAMAKLGGFAGALAKGLTAVQLALGPLAIVAGATLLVFAGLFGAFKLWDHIWTTTTDGVAMTIRQFFQDVKLVAQGVVEWWNGKGGPNSLKLFEELKKRGLEGFVGAILQFKKRLEIIFGGIWKGMKQIFFPVFAIFRMVFNAVGFLIDRFGAMFRLFRTGDDMSNQIELMEKLGQVIGWVAGVKLAIFILKTIAATGHLLAMAAATALSHAKFILLAAAITLAVLAYGEILGKAQEFGEEMGPNLWEFMDKTKRKIALFMLGFVDLGTKVMTWFREGFTNGWDGFVTWFKNQIDFLWVSTKNLFGLATDEQVNAAKALAAGKSAHTPTMATEKIAELAVRAGEGVAGARGELNKAMREEALFSAAKVRGITLEKPDRFASDDVRGAVSAKSGGESRSIVIDKPVINITGGDYGGDAKKFGQKVAESLEQTVNEEWEIGFSS